MNFSENRTAEIEALKADGSIEKMHKFIEEVKAGKRKFYVHTSLGKDRPPQWWRASVMISENQFDNPLGWSERDPGIVNVKVFYRYDKKSLNYDPKRDTGKHSYSTAILLREFIKQQVIHDAMAHFKTEP